MLSGHVGGARLVDHQPQAWIGVDHPTDAGGGRDLADDLVKILPRLASIAPFFA